MADVPERAAPLPAASAVFGGYPPGPATSGISSGGLDVSALAPCEAGRAVRRQAQLAHEARAQLGLLRKSYTQKALTR